jgi:hypothetical protein
LSGEERAFGFGAFVGASLLAMAACEPTNFQQTTPIPTVGVSLLANAA